MWEKDFLPSYVMLVSLERSLHHTCVTLVTNVLMIRE